MLTKVKTATLEGVEGALVQVETDIRRGMPAFTIVGLADTTIREACSRIKPAILNSGLFFPNERITVNLAPAGRPKEGSHFDLPIAVSLAMAGIHKNGPADTAFLGELSLDGKLNRIKGALPLVMCLRANGVRKIIIPSGNAQEAAILKDVDIMPARDFSQVMEHVTGRQQLPIYKGKNSAVEGGYDVDFSQVVGQEAVKRAVVIAAAGGHGILMMGGPGCGKTMIAKRIPTILPKLRYEEMLEITGIYSVSGLLSEKDPVVLARPFRSPHHTISAAGLLGGGARPKPGEMSLAHRGVLFLDELGEYDSGVIDAMRQPMEEGLIRITRNNREVSFPAQVMLVAAANPCKCGNLWNEKKLCTCSARQIDNYMRKLNGPFSDRIDMHIRMQPADIRQMNDRQRSGALSSFEMRKQVEAAAEIQARRYEETKYRRNGELDEKGMQRFCALDEECRELLTAAYEKIGLSMRACSKMIKVARTIADIDNKKKIEREHIAEAMMYRISDEEKGQEGL